MSRKSQYYYLSHEVDRRGVRQITDQLSEAVTVEYRGQTAPVLAQFYTSSWAVQQMQRQKKLWEHLLDAMEENYEADKEDLEEEMFRNVRIGALEEALAMLGYGEVNENTIKLIQAQAQIRYDQES
ncbi:hypothetical protein SEA_LITTLEFELLA_53 [Gordonia phage LittleFella]|nr:hypothetical protein SEA_LITTLEFELLA_53 [Gordonia phage LittleFella]